MNDHQRRQWASFNDPPPRSERFWSLIIYLAFILAMLLEVATCAL